MTSKQETFVDAYILNGGNSAAAARSAGYSLNSSKVTGAKLMKRPEIRAAIDTRLDELKSERTADVKELLEFLTSTLRGEIEEVLVVPSGKKVKVPCNCSARLRAAETLCKIYGLFRRADDEPKNDSTNLFVETLTKIWEKDNSAKQPTAPDV